MAPSSPRWHLYRLLGDPFRLRLMALAAEEELALGELAELLGESQPNVSRHATPLRQAKLLSERREGTRTFVRLSPEARLDEVVRDALATGRELCRKDGSLWRIAQVVRARDQRAREFFERPARADANFGLSPELPAYLSALSVILEHAELAIDAGTGEGALLDVLAPMFRRVIALDRSEAQLERARQRVAERNYQNVQFQCAELDDESLKRAVPGGADLVTAVRVLHHVPLPRVTLASLRALLRPGGRMIVVDYGSHHDAAFAEQQADVWLGFAPEELVGYALAAGLEEPRVRPLPNTWVQSGVDAHIPWQVLSAVRPSTDETPPSLDHR